MPQSIAKSGGVESSMLIQIGHVEAIFRYPVKSMGGERLDAANLGLARPRG